MQEYILKSDSKILLRLDQRSALGAAAIAIAVAISVAAVTTIATTAAVVDFYVFVTPPHSISMAPVVGGVTHDPIKAHR